MSRMTRLTAYLLSSVAALAWGHTAQAQDGLFSPTPLSEQTDAVSAFNGQWVLEAGWSDPGGSLFRATGSLTTPINTYGLQADFTLSNTTTQGLSGALTVHTFMRDPSAGWMLGLTKGVVITHDAALLAVGVEGELYLDRLSLEGWAGVAGVHYTDPSATDVSGFFAFGDLAYYPTDDLRLVLGASSVLGNNQLHLASEYLLRQWDLPISLVADARLGGDSSTVTVGIHGYFGGNDDHKSLILRHREDNLRLRSLDLWGAAAPIVAAAPPPAFVDPEESQGNCEAMGGEWIYGVMCDVTNISEPACDWLSVPGNSPDYQNYLWDSGLSECLYNPDN